MILDRSSPKETETCARRSLALSSVAGLPQPPSFPPLLAHIIRKRRLIRTNPSRPLKQKVRRTATPSNRDHPAHLSGCAGWETSTLRVDQNSVQPPASGVTLGAAGCNSPRSQRLCNLSGRPGIAGIVVDVWIPTIGGYPRDQPARGTRSFRPRNVALTSVSILLRKAQQVRGRCLGIEPPEGENILPRGRYRDNAAVFADRKTGHGLDMHRGAALAVDLGHQGVP